MKQCINPGNMKKTHVNLHILTLQATNIPFYQEFEAENMNAMLSEKGGCQKYRSSFFPLYIRFNMFPHSFTQIMFKYYV